MADAAAYAVQQTIVSSRTAGAIMFATSNNLATGKRKTPSELRAEQLKRARTTQSQGRSKVVHAQVSTLGSLSRGSFESKPSRLSRLVDTKVPDVYPATKFSDKPKTLDLKEKQKNEEKLQSNIEKEQTSRGISFASCESMLSPRLRCQDEATMFVQSCGEKVEPKHQEERTKEKLSNTSSSSFKNVIQLSSQQQTQSGGDVLDMAHAIRTLAASKLPQALTIGMRPSAQATSSMENASEVSDTRINQHSIVCLAKDEIPLDLSLKTSARFLSMKAFDWCQKSRTRMQCLALQTESKRDFSTVDKSFKSDSLEVLFWQSLHTWVYPQSLLPPSVLSAMVSQEIGPEKNFLAQRRRAWEDSFCSLYHMFRNSLCSLFYLCAQSFVVLFIDGGICGRSMGTFSAYMTRSTRGLRRLLQEQDVRFSMPLCKSEPEIATYEELQDLTEFEKTNPGQTRLVDSMITIDKSPKSLLAFLGKQNVHRLFNFLLNNRLMLNFTSADLPTLYAPVPFHHASLTVPEVRCKQIRLPSTTKLPGLQQSGKNSVDTESGSETSMQIAHTLEIKDAHLAPWVISKLCAILQKSHLTNFEARYFY
ncbi:hypothetical protein O6H91_07G073900 [Diphasiastrum complanatum]|uniref:Uncharacterized protein n=1 Tax=Diphasiastrum complanatum TaxID=34168 RepID=A0ACC2D6H4_DIPCM|nr:hypothetical protein O6H91_07G073900 [Diphasiastrum complanatum]